MGITTENIRKNYDLVKEKVENALNLIHDRPIQKVEIIVVSKGQPAEIIHRAYHAGIRKFGENYPDETLKKIPEITDCPNIEWHMIGHLQSRKIPIVTTYFSFIHSLDNLSHAKKVNNGMVKASRKIPVLLEMNVSGEDSKFGFNASDQKHWNELLPIIREINQLQGLEIQGLMTMPPLYNDPENTRLYFKRLAELLSYFQEQFPENKWKHLSMGTSTDYEVAVQEGATMIRVGQAILGPRSSRN